MRSAAKELRDDPAVEAVDVLEPDEGQRERWSVRVVSVEGREMIPSTVVSVFGEFGLGIDAGFTGMQGSHATVRGVC